MKKMKFLALSALLLFGSIVTTSCAPEANYYTVSFDSNGGTYVPYQSVKENEFATKPTNPTRDGYGFDVWNYRGNEFKFKNNPIVMDITLQASWSTTIYSISYQYSQDGNTTVNPSSYTIEDELILKAPSYKVGGYSFKCYQDQNGNTYNGVIPRGTFGDLVLTDIWVDKTYIVSGSNSFQTYVTGYGNYKPGDEVTISIPEDPFGYDFVSWDIRNLSGQVIFNNADTRTYTFMMPNENIFVNPNLSPFNVPLIYDLDGGTNNEKNPLEINVSMSNFYFNNPTKDHFTFVGWYLNGVRIYEFDVKEYISLYLNDSPRTIKATYELSQYRVTIKNSYSNYFTTSGNGIYRYGDTCTVTISGTDQLGYKFAGWVINYQVVSLDSSYSFVVEDTTNLEVKVLTHEYHILSMQNDLLLYDATYSQYGSLTNAIVYEYDNLGRVTKKAMYNGDCIEYSYNDVERVNCEYLNGVISYRDFYDAFGNMTKREVFNSKGTLIETYTSSYEYDDNGRVTKEVTTTNFTYTKIYTYHDDFENGISYTIFYPTTKTGGLDRYETYTYTYSNGLLMSFLEVIEEKVGDELKYNQTLLYEYEYNELELPICKYITNNYSGAYVQKVEYFYNDNNELIEEYDYSYDTDYIGNFSIRSINYYTYPEVY